MSDEEIIEYLKKDDFYAKVKTTAMISVLASSMILKGWFTKEEFEKMTTELVEKQIEMYIDNLTEEKRKDLEATIEIKEDSLFGKYFG